MPTAPIVLETTAVENPEEPESDSAAELPLVLVQSSPKRKQKPSSLWPTGHDEGAQMLLFS